MEIHCYISVGTLRQSYHIIMKTKLLQHVRLFEFKLHVSDSVTAFDVTGQRAGKRQFFLSDRASFYRI